MSQVAFGPFRFETRTQLLFRGDEEITLPPRAAALLGHLLDHSGALMTKEELMDLVWADAEVSDTSLKEAIHILRQALDDRATRSTYVQTVPRRGYRFIAPVRSVAGSASEPKQKYAPQLYRWLFASLTVASIAMLVGFWLGRRGPTAPAPLPHRFALEIQSDHHLSPGPSNLALSSDGRHLVYAAKTVGSKWHLYLRSMDDLAVRAIPGTAGGRAPFFSPDGTLGFFTPDELRSTSLVGGTVRTICQVSQGLGGTWSGGQIIFSTFETRDAVGLWSVPASGGRPRVLTTLEGEVTGHRWPEAVGGNAVLYTMWRSRLDDSSVALLDLASGESTVLFEGGGSARYLPGFLVYARSSELLAVPFDADQQAVIGTPATVVRQVATTPVWGTAHFDVSAGGSLIYMPASQSPRHRLLRLEPGTPEQAGKLVAKLERAVMDMRLAPDAERLLITTQGAALDLWTLELDRGAVSRLTDDGTSHAGVFSSDGAHVFYASRQQGRPGIYRRATTGGAAELVYSTATAAMAYAVTDTPAGEVVLIAEAHEESGWDLMILDGTDGDVRPFLTTPFNEKSAALSPDSQLVAYQSDETGKNEIYLRRFPTGTARWPVSSGGGTRPLFSADGQEIFFRRGRKIFATPVDLRLPVPEIGQATLRFEGLDVAGYSMASDGAAVLLLEDEGDGQASAGLVHVVHFSTELRGDG